MTCWISYSKREPRQQPMLELFHLLADCGLPPVQG